CLLRLKYVGGWERVVGRIRRSDERLSGFNRAHGLGVCTEAVFTERYRLMKEYSGPVPGLGGEALAEGPIYTTDWCSNNVPLWRTLVAGLEGRPDLRALEVVPFA